MNPKSSGRSRPSLPLSLELMGVLEWRRDAFERRFGRPHRKGEPLFFDPEAEVPRRLPFHARRQAVAQSLVRAGLSERKVADFVAGFRY